MSSVPLKAPDAGTRDVDHCKSVHTVIMGSLLVCTRLVRRNACRIPSKASADKTRLAAWRYDLRHALITVIRSETPLLAEMQRQWRTSALDAYFASSANLGTHTFFLIILPVSFWCGQASFARAMTNVLAAGVFFSGALKDLLCLPRPMSPPLQRISKSTSAALEYGFPSTHSTNAVSVAVYAIYALHTSPYQLSRTLFAFLHLLALVYVTSIVLGRIYCGMHGYFDVIFGSILGLLIGGVQCYFGSNFDHWTLDGPLSNTIIAVIAVLILVRLHPEPVDDCPCFDDSVSFAGVFAGVQLGGWHFARTRFSWSEPISSTIPFDFDKLGWTKVTLRMLIGVLIILAWRGLMKSTLLKLLPPLFRSIEKLGLLLPRRFFLSASCVFPSLFLAYSHR